MTCRVCADTGMAPVGVEQVGLVPCPACSCPDCGAAGTRVTWEAIAGRVTVTCGRCHGTGRLP